jgi:hypothetical protein
MGRDIERSRDPPITLEDNRIGRVEHLFGVGFASIELRLLPDAHAGSFQEFVAHAAVCT